MRPETLVAEQTLIGPARMGISEKASTVTIGQDRKAMAAVFSKTGSHLSVSTGEASPAGTSARSYASVLFCRASSAIGTPAASFTGTAGDRATRYYACSYLAFGTLQLMLSCHASVS